MRAQRRINLAIGLLVLAAAFCGNESVAFEETRIVVPTTSPNKLTAFSPTTGLRVEVDTEWFGSGGGYLPAIVRVESQTPSLSPRRIGVRLDLSSAAGRIGGRRYTKDEGVTNAVRFELVLPANQTQAEQRVLCLVPPRWEELGLTVEVDGQGDPPLSGETGLQRGGVNRSGGGPKALRILGIDLGIGSAVGQTEASFGTSARSWMVLDQVNAEPLDDWLSYSAVDVIRLKVGDLRTLDADSPERLSLIRRWLVAGGTLWIEYAAPDQSKSLEETALQEIDELLRIAPWRFEANESEQNPPAIDLVEEPSVAGDLPDEEAEERQKAFLPCLDAAPWGYATTKEPAPSALQLAGELITGRKSRRSRRGSFDSSSWYALREAGFGRVYAFRRKALPAPSGLAPGIAEMTKQAWRKRDWTRRHGIDSGGKSVAFSNLLIPGVGVAPVTEFQVLITLFVLAIGPLNYWLLWRRQQLQMLVVTAPLGAIAATLGLCAYAAVADGFGIKARARSVTLLDQTAGEAASWSRVTHYAATPPAVPAAFDSETAVYPITPALESAIGHAEKNRVIEWNGTGSLGDKSLAEQRLVSGWMPARTAVQHLLVRSRATQAKLVFAGAGEKMSVENRLGAPIELLLVRDQQGEWRRGETIAAGGEVKLEPVERRALVREYRLLAVENEPQFPLGAGKAVEQTLQRLGQAGSRRQRVISEVELVGNLANQQFRRLSGLAGGETLNLPPRTYVAVTRSAVETPLGWDDVQELGSFHVTVGRW